MTEIQSIDPLAAVAVAGDTPRPSDLAVSNKLEVGNEVDVEGTAFDPSRHSIGFDGLPKKTTDGRFWKKTGNGARRLAGKPLAGGINLPPAGKPVAPRVNQEQVAPVTLQGGSTFVPPSQTTAAPTPGEAGAVDALPVAENLTPDQCKATATAITDGAIGMARMVRGEHWAARADERSQLIDCLSRLWALYNLPRLGPIVELMMLVVSFILNGEKRREDIKKLWDWALGRQVIPATESPEVRL